MGLIMRRRGQSERQEHHFVLERSLLSLMEDSDAKDLSKESLKEEAMVVAELTDRSAVMRWHDLSSDSDMVIEHIGGGASTASLLAWEESSKNTLSSQERELKQAYYNCPKVQIPEERLAGDEELQQVLADQLVVETAYDTFLSLLYPGDVDKQAAIRAANASSDEHSLVRALCCMANLTPPPLSLCSSTSTLNIRVDEVATNVDLAEVARRACLAETSDSSLTGRAFPGLIPAEQLNSSAVA